MILQALVSGKGKLPDFKNVFLVFCALRAIQPAPYRKLHPFVDLLGEPYRYKKENKQEIPGKISNPKTDKSKGYRWPKICLIPHVLFV